MQTLLNIYTRPITDSILVLLKPKSQQSWEKKASHFQPKHAVLNFRGSYLGLKKMKFLCILLNQGWHNKQERLIGVDILLIEQNKF